MCINEIMVKNGAYTVDTQLIHHRRAEDSFLSKDGYFELKYRS